MVVRRSTNSYAALRKRLTHETVVGRSEPFRHEDAARVEAALARITNGQEHMRTWRWDGRNDVMVYHFSEASHAEAFKMWAWREKISALPAAQYGPTSEERSAFEEVAIRWGVRTGALRRVVQAYRRTMHEGGSMLRCRTAAQTAYRAELPPAHADRFDVSEIFVSWAMRRYPDWFHGWRPPAYDGSDDFAPQDAYPHSDG